MTQQWNISKETAGKFTLSNGGLTAQQTGASNFSSILGTEGVSSGKFYWETTLNITGGNNVGTGLANASVDQTDNIFIGQNTNGIAYYSTNGGIFYNNVQIFTFATFTAVQLIGIAIDLGNNNIWWRLGASGNWNNNAANNPATNTGGVTLASVTVGAVFPAICTNLTSDEWTAGFASSSWVGTAPAGFLPFDATLPPAFEITF